MTVSKPTAAEVMALTSTGFSESVVSAIIDEAASIVESCVSGYDSARQAAIVKWVAAHMIASTGAEGVLTSDKLGDAQQSFARGQLGDALRGTTYGQTALLLDTNGCLSKLGRGKAVFQRV